MYKISIFVLLSLTLMGCSSVNVKPWERGNLAKPSMTFGGDSMIDTTDDHVYFSKEASSAEDHLVPEVADATKE